MFRRVNPDEDSGAGWKKNSAPKAGRFPNELTQLDFSSRKASNRKLSASAPAGLPCEALGELSTIFAFSERPHS